VQVSNKLPDLFGVAERFVNAARNGRRSIPWYLPKLDGATGGLERQTLTILAARPSVGKTALAWQVARQAAYDGKRVIFFSLEMSDVNLFARSACPPVNTTWRDVRAGNVAKETLDRLEEEAYRQAAQFEDRLVVLETSQTTESIWRIVAEHRPDMIVVDHLRLLQDKADSEVRRLGDASQRLKDISRNFDCAVLLLAQLNRQSENRADKRPNLADLRDSGQIEENGDLILMLHREFVFGEKPGGERATEIWIRKFRDGPRDVLINSTFNTREEWFS